MYLPLFLYLYESFWKGFESDQRRLTLLVIKYASLTWDETWVSYLRRARQAVACENIRFSSLFAAEDVSRGGTSAIQQQKFHTDDANQCLHNIFGSHGVPNINLSNFTCLLVDFGKVLCLSANHLQQNSMLRLLEKAIFHKYWLFCWRLFVFTFDLCGLLSFVCQS